MRAYLTGGTTRTPRIVWQTEECWESVIDDTSRLLIAAGVQREDVALVAHPGIPWAIGEVFTEALARLGAHPLAVGLHATHPSLVACLRDANVRVLTGPPRLLAQLAHSLIGHVSSSPLFISAGDTFDLATVQSIRDTASDVRLASIYGHSELGSLGLSHTAPFNCFTMIERYTYYIQLKGPMEEGNGIGELIVRASGGREIATGDRGRLRPTLHSTDPSVVELMGRLAESTTLSDGTILSAEAVVAARDALGLLAIQVIVERHGDADAIRVLVVPSQEPCSADDVSAALASAHPELTDLLTAPDWQRGSIELQVVTATALVTSARGKTPVIVDRRSEASGATQ